MSWNVLFASLPVLVLTHYGGRPELLGWLFGGFGAGCLAGSAVAFRIVGAADKLLLAAVAILAQMAPLWLLPLPVPAAVLVGAMALSGLFNPIVNAPMGAVMLTRTPAALRASAGSVPIVLDLRPAAPGADGGGRGPRARGGEAGDGGRARRADVRGGAAGRGGATGAGAAPPGR